MATILYNPKGEKVKIENSRTVPSLLKNGYTVEPKKQEKKPGRPSKKVQSNNTE